MEKIETKRRLDARGMSCPMPSVKTALELEEMEPGEILEVITDDPVSKKDLPVWALASGNTVLEVSEGVIEGHEAITIYVQKG
ncbi:MAG: sulfurtransferase TusA family protein [Thermodesulfobacteriota bacterium]